MIRNLMVAACLAPTAGIAEGISIELNGLETKESACRMVFTAQSPEGVEGLVVETVLFETSGAVTMLTLFDFVDLPAGSLRVRQFDIPDRSCADVGRILFNGVDSCDGAGCAAPLSVTSRVESVEVLG